MKIKVKDLKKLIRENYAREIPQYAIDQTYSAAIKLKDHRKIFDYCKEELTHFFKMNIKFKK